MYTFSLYYLLSILNIVKKIRLVKITLFFYIIFYTNIDLLEIINSITIHTPNPITEPNVNSFILSYLPYFMYSFLCFITTPKIDTPNLTPATNNSSVMLFYLLSIKNPSKITYKLL